MVRAMASVRLIWPSIRLLQVGVFASSKSAMKTLEPEFSALIIILRSVGPVISMRRSWRSAGNRSDGPFGFANVLRFRQEIGLFARIEPLLALLAGGQQLQTAGIETAVKLRQKMNCFRRKHLILPRMMGRIDSDPAGRGMYAHAIILSSSAEIIRLAEIRERPVAAGPQPNIQQGSPTRVLLRGLGQSDR